jgi:hypothetical protein
MAATAEREALTIRMSGVFDVPAARRFADALGEAHGRAVHVDVTQVREFHDFAVALLARALSGRERTTVTGLREHHVRLLAYLGIDAGPGLRDAAERG